ncbi:MAG TPA: hypothetical protein VMT00_09000 [Thermoanaerobaculia bacterium]|nr:hypothetical protein [Thermoanaerobaculia bacterium]
MAETTPVSPRGINWSSALIAGLVATAAITMTLALFGTNIMKMLGSTMLGEEASAAAQYTVGGMLHLTVGLVYGILFAWLFGPVAIWNRLLKGIVYGLAVTAVALATMPVMMAMMGGGGAANPCAASNPCTAAGNPSMQQGAMSGGAVSAGNPCAPGASNPCAPDASNPCAPSTTAENPCAAEPSNPCQPPAAAANPCNPCKEAHAANPCNPCGAANAPKTAGNACGAGAGNPCNPCGGSGGPFDGMISLINHLVYALGLAFAYRPRSL